ncbi:MULTISPECIES: hypothetical protein [Roseomonadaceae]|uniref:Discoidin domain-containing protein n=1 Tax=Falsiroseomonas oleicola TaxID=2801474 RepID=A0ABS6H949_9PROT|nr:hypothetical protein [Roseomonas oleicola]MBU8544001.1 hypothetical protein [Roseomonas oleicola]
MGTLISWVNLADAAAEISATSEGAGLGVRNLLTEPVAEVWRCPPLASGAAAHVNVDLGGARTIGLVALFAPRDGLLVAGYSVRLFLSAVAAGGDDVADVALAPLDLPAGRGAWRYVLPVPAEVRFIQLRFVSGGAGEYLQLGRLWIGPDFRPAVPFSRTDHARGVISAGLAERSTISGILSAQRGATLRNPTFSLPLLTDAEADVVEDMALAAGNFGQVVASPRTQAGAAGFVLGRFETPPSPRIVTPLRWSASFSVVEDL